MAGREGQNTVPASPNPGRGGRPVGPRALRRGPSRRHPGRTGRGGKDQGNIQGQYTPRPNAPSRGGKDQGVADRSAILDSHSRLNPPSSAGPGLPAETPTPAPSAQAPGWIQPGQTQPWQPPKMSPEEWAELDARGTGGPSEWNHAYREPQDQLNTGGGYETQGGYYGDRRYGPPHRNRGGYQGGGWGGPQQGYIQSPMGPQGLPYAGDMNPYGGYGLGVMSNPSAYLDQTGIGVPNRPIPIGWSQNEGGGLQPWYGPTWDPGQERWQTPTGSTSGRPGGMIGTSPGAWMGGRPGGEVYQDPIVGSPGYPSPGPYGGDWNGIQPGRPGSNAPMQPGMNYAFQEGGLASLNNNQISDNLYNWMMTDEGAQGFQEGGSVGEPMPIDINPMPTDVNPDMEISEDEMGDLLMEVRSAIRGEHPDAEMVIATFIEVFGPEEFERIRQEVYAEMEAEMGMMEEMLAGSGGQGMMPQQAPPEMMASQGQMMPPQGQMMPPQGGPEMMPQQGVPQMMANGGIAGLTAGPGGGMGDRIPASIDGQQEARLSAGEYVVPADVVSGLGNGDTTSGAQALDVMGNRVRESRTGMMRQPEEIDPMMTLPA